MDTIQTKEQHSGLHTDYLSSTVVEDDHRLVTEARAKEIYARLGNMMTGGGEFQLIFNAWWRGSLRWARNRVSEAGDQRDIEINVVRKNQYGEGSVGINQVDDASLRAAMTAAERQANLRSLSSPGFITGIPRIPQYVNPLLPYPETTIWSDATFNIVPEQRATLAQTLMQGADTQQLLSAGYLEMAVHERQSFGPNIMVDRRPDLRYSNEPPQGQGAARKARDEGFVRYTQSQCSMTVRHPKGLGSGWAGQSGYDWSVIDSPRLAQRALDKCVASLNPVAIEPGRYVVILEPQAVYEFAEPLTSSMSMVGRRVHEDLRRPNVWSEDVDPTLGMRMTKLGQKIIDERISITSDPMDLRLGTAPQLGMGPVTFVENGVLTNLTYNREYALEMLREEASRTAGHSMHPFVMSGGTTTMEEMIASTPRGVIVTRFSNINDIWGAGLSMMKTGLTRDGLWLVENGKITKAVKNMRFTDSPLFVFNQVEQLGVPVPVFGNRYSINPPIVPPLKTRDFAFTATIDAI